MKQIYPFMKQFEPIFNKYGYSLGLKSKLNIVALHKDYYAKYRLWLTKIKEYLRYAAELKSGYTNLYIDKMRINDAALKEEFLNSIRNKIKLLLFPERECEQKNNLIDLFTKIEEEFRSKEIQIGYTNSADESIWEYLGKFMNNIMNLMPIINLNEDISAKSDELKTIMRIIIDVDVQLKCCNICTMILKMRASLCYEKCRNCCCGDEEFHETFSEISTTFPAIVDALSKNKILQEDFESFLTWKLMQIVDCSDIASMENAKSEIANWVRSLYFMDIDDLLEVLCHYVDLYEVKSNKKIKLAKVLDQLFETSDKPSWENMLGEVNRCLNDINFPIFALVILSMCERIDDSLNNGLNSAPINTKEELLLAYFNSLEELFEKYKDKVDGNCQCQGINENTEKRNAQREIVVNGINYSLAAQYVYTNLTGNIMAIAEIGTPLKQKEGAAIYDILEALGIGAPKLNLGDYPNEEKAKYQAVLPAFKVGSGGYNIQPKVKKTSSTEQSELFKYLSQINGIDEISSIF